MEAEDKFVRIATLLCEPVRAKILWNLLDGRAYTASELSAATGVSASSTSNHLSKLLSAEIIKVGIQGRHRYYSFSNPEVAYTVEGLANLATSNVTKKSNDSPAKAGVKFCRSCYDHLAGLVGVSIVEALEAKGYLRKSKTVYSITKSGWEWFEQLNITRENLNSPRRPLTRQCLDWSERRPHLAGQLGAALLKTTMERKWFKKVQFSRELIITSLGRRELYERLSIKL